MFKIHGATVSTNGPSLCSTCKWARVIEGARSSERLVYCTEIGRELKWEARSCSYWQDQTKPSRYEFEDIAWVLRTNPSKGHVGFISPKQLKKEQEEQGPTQARDDE